MVWTRWRPPPAAALLVADAIGLGAYSVVGARIAEAAGLPPASGILLGTVTGAAGGAVRDVLCAEIPLVLRRGNLYASAAVAGTSVYFGLTAAGVPHGMAGLAGSGVVIAVRLAAIRWGLRLPAFRVPDDMLG